MTPVGFATLSGVAIGWAGLATIAPAWAMFLGCAGLAVEAVRSPFRAPGWMPLERGSPDSPDEAPPGSYTIPPVNSRWTIAIGAALFAPGVVIPFAVVLRLLVDHLTATRAGRPPMDSSWWRDAGWTALLLAIPVTIGLFRHLSILYGSPVRAWPDRLVQVVGGHARRIHYRQLASITRTRLETMSPRIERGQTQPGTAIAHVDVTATDGRTLHLRAQADRVRVALQWAFAEIAERWSERIDQGEEIVLPERCGLHPAIALATAVVCPVAIIAVMAGSSGGLARAVIGLATVALATCAIADGVLGRMREGGLVVGHAGVRARLAPDGTVPWSALATVTDRGHEIHLPPGDLATLRISARVPNVFAIPYIAARRASSASR